MYIPNVYTWILLVTDMNATSDGRYFWRRWTHVRQRSVWHPCIACPSQVSISKFTCDGLTCDGCQIYFGRTWFHVRPKSMSVQSTSVRSNVFGHVRQAYIRPKSNFMSVPYCPSKVTSVCDKNLLWTDMTTSVRCIFPVVMLHDITPKPPIKSIKHTDAHTKHYLRTWCKIGENKTEFGLGCVDRCGCM